MHAIWEKTHEPKRTGDRERVRAAKLKRFWLSWKFIWIRDQTYHFIQLNVFFAFGVSFCDANGTDTKFSDSSPFACLTYIAKRLRWISHHIISYRTRKSLRVFAFALQMCACCDVLCSVNCDRPIQLTMRCKWKWTDSHRAILLRTTGTMQDNGTEWMKIH